MDDDQEARNRLLVYTLLRGGGVLMFLFGVAIIYTDLLRPGGWPQVGAIIAIVGVVDATVMPLLMKRSWDKKGKGQE